MNKIKSLAVAVALAVAAGSAHADIATGATGNGELFLSVWDKVGQQSYIRDLGISVNAFGTLNAPTQTAAAPGSFVNYVDGVGGFTQSWATDATWGTFTAGKTAADISNFVYDVYAMDSAGSSAFQQVRYLTTTNADLTAWATTSGTQFQNGQVTSMALVNNYLDQANLDDTQTVGVGAANNTANGSGIFTGGIAYMGNGAKLETWGANTNFLTTATVGSAVDFYYITRSSSTNTQEARAYQYGNTAGDATFLLANDGTLTYQVAAVPEAETWAMFGAGLLMVGAIARRRMAS